MSDIKFISASAGSGKTHRLMNLMADKVAPGPAVDGRRNEAIPAGSLLATTFTEKAASELRSRVRAKLMECGKVSEAQDVLTGLVGTVNAVSGRLVEEYAFELGLPPGQKVISSGDDGGQDFASIIYDRAISEVCAACASEIEPLAARFDLLTSDASGARSWKDMVAAIVRDARYNAIGPEDLEYSKRKCIEWTGRIYPGTENKSLRQWLSEEVSSVASQLDEVLTPGAVSGLLKGFVECAERFKALPQENSYRAIYDFLREIDIPDDPFRANVRTRNQSALDVHAKIQELCSHESSAVSRRFMHDPELRRDSMAFVDALFDIAGKCMVAYAEFKSEHGLVDFTDQVAYAHELFRRCSSGAFGKAFKERVKALMVDEFQDTSPIEMSLFLEMSRLVPDVTFVGDAKQAIYGFKGTDPSLMAAVAAKVAERRDASAVETLRYSWRSKKNLIDFVNGVFVPAFAMDGMAPDSVRLELPPARVGKEEWKGGEIEAWTLGVSDRNKQYGRLAEAIVDFVRREGIEARLSDIAVLLRTNSECDKLAQELTDRGVPVSCGSDVLKDALECRLAMAAYRYAVNHDDTVALATLAAYFMSPDGWLRQLSADKAETLRKWREDPRIVALGSVGDLTPSEMLDWAIGVIGLSEDIARRSDSDRRFRNLEELRGLCGRYMTESSLGGYPATPAGFVGYVSRSTDKCSSAKGGNCVQVLTYHKAKGLEWPTVILATLDHGPQDNPFSQKVVSDLPFSMDDPLAGRYIRFAPNPFENKLRSRISSAKKQNVDRLLRESDDYAVLADEVENDGWREMRRLMYVGVTRAKERLVFAPCYDGELFGTKWIDKLASGKVEFKWNVSDFQVVVHQNGHDDGFTVKVRDFPASNDSLKIDIPAEFRIDGMGGEYKEYSTAYCRPSDEKLQAASVPFQVNDLKSCLVVKNDDVGDASSELGNALHNFYALSVRGPVLQSRGADGLADRLRRKWKVEHLVEADEMDRSAEVLKTYIADRWRNAEVFTEIPMLLRNNRGQVYQGFIDMLVRVEGGYVIIDHKTTLEHDYDEVVQKYAGQLLVYKQAVEVGLGNVVSVVLHLPACGVCLECDL